MVERYKRQTVLWLFQNVQVSFAEIAEVMSTTRDEVERLYREAKAEQDRIFNSPTPFRLIREREEDEARYRQARAEGFHAGVFHENM